MVYLIQIMHELEFWHPVPVTAVCPPKGCGMKSYLRLVESYTRALKKVSDVEINPDNESNADKQSNANKESDTPSSFSAMLKSVKYSDSENSVSPTKISSSVGHYGAVPLSPQNAHVQYS